MATTLRQERPDYVYLKEVFRELRTELGIVVPRTPKRLPYVPSEEEIRRYCETVWRTRKLGDLVLIKTLVYTGVRVSELVAVRLTDVDFDRCQVRINEGKGRKDRLMACPSAFNETLVLHHDRLRQRGANFLFESSWKKPYSDRGVRRLLERYATAASLAHPISPHRLRHFLLTRLKTQGIDDALIQRYSGHANRESLEIYSRLAIADAQTAYARHGPVPG